MELPTSSCHGILYPRYYGLVGTFSCKPPGGSRIVVLLSPRVWKGCQRLGTKNWYLMHYSNPSVTGGQKHTHTAHKYSNDPAIHMPNAPPLHPHQEPTASPRVLPTPFGTPPPRVHTTTVSLKVPGILPTRAPSSVQKFLFPPDVSSVGPRQNIAVHQLGTFLQIQTSVT